MPLTRGYAALLRRSSGTFLRNDVDSVLHMRHSRHTARQSGSEGTQTIAWRRLLSLFGTGEGGADNGIRGWGKVANGIRRALVLRRTTAAPATSVVVAENSQPRLVSRRQSTVG